MAQVPLAQQTELPPSRAGVAKAPFSLADRSGQIGLGRVIAKGAGDIFDDLIRTRAANEQSEAVGAMEAEIEGIRTFMAANPKAPIEKYQKEVEKRMLNISRLPSQATTGIGRNNITNLVTRNKGRAFARFQTIIAAEDSKRQLARSELLIKGFEDNLDMTGLESHYFGENGTVAANLYDKETTEIRFENQVAVNEVAQRKLEVDNTAETAVAVFEGTVTDENPLGDKEIVNEFIKQNVPSGLRDDVEREVNTRINNRRKEREIQTDAIQSNNQNQIASDIYSGAKTPTEIDAVIDQAFVHNEQGIRGLTLQMVKSLKTLNKRDNIVTSDETNIKIDRLLSDITAGKKSYEQAVTEYTTKIAGGVSPSEGAGNLDAIRAAADSAGDPILKRAEVVRALSALQRIRSAEIGPIGELLPEEIAEIEALSLRTSNELEAWAVANKTDPDFTAKFEIEAARLLTPIIDEVTLTKIEFLLAGPGRFITRATPVGFIARRLIKPIDEALIEKRLGAIKKEPRFKFLATEQQERVIGFIEAGSTVRQAIAGAGGVAAPLPRITTQAEYDALPSGAEAIDSDGTRFRKK